MGNPLTNLVHGLKAGTPAAKAVLYVFADVGCDDCGRAWPGVPFIAERTEIGTTRVRKAIAELVEANLLRVHAYPTGGRGMTTEYIVLPQVPKLSTAPCGKCSARSKTQRTGVGFSRQGNVKATAFGSNTQQTGVDHPLENHDPLGSAAPRAVEPTPTGIGGEASSAATPQAGIPASVKDALRALGLFDPPPEAMARPTEGKAQG